MRLPSTRTQLIATTVVTLVGIIGLAGYGWLSLTEAKGAARFSNRQLDHVLGIAKLEEQLHLHLGDAGDSLCHRPASPVLLELVADLEASEWVESERALMTELATEIRRPPAGDGDPCAYVKAQRLASKLEKRMVRRSQGLLESAKVEKQAQASHIVELGLFVVIGFAGLSTFLLLRLRRERRETLTQLRESDRLAALGTIAASVAHEINNPLATIGGCASAVRDRLRRSGAQPGSLEYLDMIVGETRRCTGIVNSLSELARDAPLAVSNADLGDLADDVVAMLHLDGAEKAVEFEVERRGAAELVCDPDKIKQLLINLLVNARDASDDGGRIHVRVGSGGEGFVELVVRDHGCGIHPDRVEEVFEAFHTAKAKGLGIGLFLCRRIVALHEGDIDVASDGPGTGATFTVRLPSRLDR